MVRTSKALPIIIVVLVVGGCASASTSNPNADNSQSLAQSIHDDAPSTIAQGVADSLGQPVQQVNVRIANVSCSRSGAAQNYTCPAELTAVVNGTNYNYRLGITGHCDAASSCTWKVVTTRRAG